MTLDEVQVALENAEVAILYVGWASKQARGKPATKWSVTIGAAQASRRWRHCEPRIRGIGPTIDAAMTDAMTQLAALVLAMSEEG